ncbi:parallel beta-helix repeat (two copies) [Thermoplasmatales archaeon SCGC AB-539-C06]|nr:parallel beta-helix repeat (two copies) [Thermoplasmatales archaeon SCGC AB-539-C06]
MPDTWLKKKLVCAVIVLFIGLSIFPGMSSYNQVLGNTIYVDDDAVPGWYDATHVKTIQEGILNATIGETIYVYSGIYVENVVVNKTVNLVGENKNTTIVDGNESGEVMLVKGTWPFGNVSIRNFKIVNCSMSGWHGVTSGIRIENCSNNTVSNCIFLDCYDGLYLESSWNNIVGDNSFDINVNYGNITFGNNSIRLYYADNNTIFGNTINNSTLGIHLAGNSMDNKIYHNNFVNNLGQASDDTGNNTWDNGYPSGGNYWDDFDEPSEGAYDNNSDGIVDSPYYIYSLYGNASDRYPLIDSFEPSYVYVDDNYDSFTPGWGYDHFDNITNGIGAVKENGTVFVYAGIYIENVLINKTGVNLVGENKNTTIVDGNESGEVIFVAAGFDNVSIRNFKIVNSNLGGHGVGSGIRMENSSNCNVSNCIFLDCYDGLYFVASYNNIVMDNIFDISVNYAGSTVANNSIRLYYTGNNTIFGNTITNSTVGIDSIYSDSRIYHNNFLNNLHQAVDNDNTTWDNGYPSGGNYWDDFDEPSEGAYDNNTDGIVDSSYNISIDYSYNPGYSSDNYPLINPWNDTPPAPPPNNPPNMSSTPSGPSTRETGQSGSYSTSASDPDGDQVQYRFDWDADGSHDYSTWTSLGASGHTGIVSNSWISRGMYVVKSQARDEHLAESSWSSGLTVVVSPNNPPVADAGGPYTGVVDEPITFDGSGSFDSDGSIVGYRWDWKNDGGWDTDWLVNSKKSHTYDSEYYGMARLEVKDNMGATDIDTVIVDVEENQQPIVDIISPEENAMVSGTISINGIASDPNGNNTLESVEVKIDDGSWNTADGTTSWNYSWDTTLFDDGFHTIYARSFDGEVYSDECSVNVNVTNTMSDVIVDEILGGFRVSARIKNNGTSSAYDVNWSIELEGGFILIGRSSEGVISELVPGASKTIRPTILYGIGRTTITVTAGDATKQATGFILGPLVLGVEEI